jgi:2-polyprenyl-3-methyl-5-hydroxy-6-metoxy-1,4-benzoquinol methylase
MTNKRISKKDTSCFGCGKNDFQRLFTSHDYLFHLSGEFTIKRCQNCGLLALSPQPTNSELKKYYPEKKYYSYSLKCETNIVFSIRKYLIRHSGETSLYNRVLSGIFPLPAIPTYKKAAKLLDIGCGSGQTLKVLNEMGWDTYGFDIDKGAVAIAKKRGLKNIRCGSFEILKNYPDNYFDAVRMNHVIEHLYQPESCIKLVYSKLKKGGEFLICTPTFDSLAGYFGKQYWFNLDTPRHLFIVNPKILSLLLVRNGFIVRRVQYCSGGGLLASLQYFLEDKYKWQTHLLEKRWLLLLFYPVDWILDLFHMGDIYEIYAIK